MKRRPDPIRHDGCAVRDCTLDGMPIRLADWPKISSESLARIVGVHAPSDPTEYAQDYDWRFVELPTELLRCASQDGDEPDGGWEQAYRDHARRDIAAVAAGSPEYAGRQKWLREHWCRNTAIYPLFVVLEENDYRLWDGHRRLAAAFFHRVPRVAVVLGTKKA